MKPANYLTLLALLGSLTTASAESPRLPYSEKVPMNLSNQAIPGTSVQSSKGIGNAESLLTSNQADSSSIPSGKSEVIVKLVGQHLVTDFQFVNDGAEGKVAASSSIDEKTWTPLGQVPFTSTTRLVPVRFAGVGARYIKVNFELTKGSTIRAFQIFGATTNKDYKFAVGGSTEAAGSGTPRPIYAFPTPVNVNEEDFKRNNFKFPKTKDRYRTIIYDLGNVRTIKEFSTAYSSKPTRLEVFAFEQLPEKKDWRGKLTFDPANLDKVKPVAVGVDARGEGHLLVKPEKPVNAQYVAMRYEPNYTRNGAQTSLEGEASMIEFVAAAFEPYTSIAKEMGMGGQFIAAGDTQSEEDSEFFIGGIDFGSLGTYQPTFNPNSGPGGGGQGGGQGATPGGTPGNTNGQDGNNNGQNGNNNGQNGNNGLDSASTAAIGAMNSYFSNPSFSGGGVGGGGGGGIGNPFQVPTGVTLPTQPGTNPPPRPTRPTIIVAPATPPPVPPASS